MSTDVDNNLGNVDQIKSYLEENPEKISEIIDESPSTREAVMASIIQSKTEIHAGPIPDPDTLERYKDIDEELFKTIVTMAKSQNDHRISIEKQVVSSNLSSQKRGQFFAFILFLITIIGSFSLIYLGKNWGMIGVISVFISGIGLFLEEKQKQNTSLEKKDTEMVENKPEEYNQE